MFYASNFGGGISSINDISSLLKAGADKVSINTSHTKNLKFIKDACKTFGGQNIVISIDYRSINENIKFFKFRKKKKLILIFTNI